MARPSLSAQLTRGLLPWLALIWIASGIAVALYVHRGIERRLDRSLMESAERLLDLAAHEVDELRAQTGASGMAALLPAKVANHSGDDAVRDSLVYQIVTDTGALVLRSSDAPPARIGVPLTRGFTNTGPWRVYTLKHHIEPLYIHVADALEARDDIRRTTLLGLLLPLLGILPALALLIREVTRAKLVDVGRLAAEIGERGGSNLQPLQDGALPNELLTIRDNTNHLLQRLSHALDTERALAANAAHELRTPLATLRLQLQTLREQALASAQGAIVTQALEALDRLSRRTEKLLQFSRAESGASLGREPIDLAHLAASVAEEFWRNPAHLPRLALHLPAEHDVIVQGDADTLGLAIRNLVENALRHVPQGRIDLVVMPPGTVLVRDQGAILPAAELALLQTRHVRRATTAEAPSGYGLGLSIVQTIVARHGGALVLQSPAPDRACGLEARIELPPNPPLSSSA
jgi:two-component system OmpR family sensor kinase